MNKTLFDQCVDFTQKESEIIIPLVGDVVVTTKVYPESGIWAKFTRFSPNAFVEIKIEGWLTGVRLQYIVQDDLIRKTISVNTNKNKTL